jgi:hypothetical protein
MNTNKNGDMMIEIYIYIEREREQVRFSPESHRIGPAGGE